MARRLPRHSADSIMPNPQAKAAFDDATELANRLRHAHAMEQAALDRLAELHNGNEPTDILEAEVRQSRKDWAALFDQYKAAMKRYTAAVEHARNGSH